MPSPTSAVKNDLLAVFENLVLPLLEEARGGHLTARRAETGCWEVVLAVGAALLRGTLGLMCRAAAEELVVERGWTLDPSGPEGTVARCRRDADYTAQLSTTFGRIAVPLHAVRAPGRFTTLTPSRSLFPHYPKMRSTELLVEWECAVAADHPFRKAAEALEYFSHGAVDIEDTTIERHAVAIGNHVPPSWFYAEPGRIREVLATRATVDCETGLPIVYASTDAHALKRFVDDKWNPKWKMVNGIRVWAIDKDTGKTIHLGGEYTWGDCLEVRRCFQRLQREGVLPSDGDYGDGVVAQIALVTDGLDWIAGYVLSLFPAAVLSLDPYHVIEHVSEAAKRAWPGKKNEPKVRRILKEARRAIGMRKRRSRTVFRKGPNRARHKTRRTGYDGSGQRLLDEVLRPLLDQATRGTKRIRQAIAYVERNLYRLDYGELRTRGFHIGSGAMESLHRTGSQVRLKRAGCHWTKEAAQAILNLRMLALSGRWKEYWNQANLPHLKPLGLAA